MRYFLQQIVMAAAALSLTSFLLPGLSISGGFTGYLLASVFLMVGFLIVRPILNVATLPLRLITLGLFSVVVTSFVLFLITKLDHGFIISSFQSSGFSFLGLTVPPFHANLLLSYILISVTIQLTYRLLAYVFDL